MDIVILCQIKTALFTFHCYSVGNYLGIFTRNVLCLQADLMYSILIATGPSDLTAVTFSQDSITKVQEGAVKSSRKKAEEYLAGRN